MKIDPTCIVETKNGYHLYFVLKKPLRKQDLSPEEWLELVRQYEIVLESVVTALGGGDPGAKDATRVLRRPGSLHQKDPNEPFLVKIIQHNEECLYSLEELVELYPPLSKDMFQKKTICVDNSGNITEKDNLLPPYIIKGLLRCQKCGCSMTPERKVKKSGKEFVYYSCTNY